MMSSYLACTLPEQKLRVGLDAHQEHRVNRDAQAADRTKVPAKVIQVAAYEMNTDSDKAESVVPVTLKIAKVRVIPSRMTLPLRWPLMLNSMSVCKLHMLQ